jgi:hypothetical protein
VFLFVADTSLLGKWQENNKVFLKSESAGLTSDKIVVVVFTILSFNTLPVHRNLLETAFSSLRDVLNICQNRFADCSMVIYI